MHTNISKTSIKPSPSDHSHDLCATSSKLDSTADERTRLRSWSLELDPRTHGLGSKNGQCPPQMPATEEGKLTLTIPHLYTKYDVYGME